MESKEVNEKIDILYDIAKQDTELRQYFSKLSDKEKEKYIIELKMKTENENKKNNESVNIKK